MKTGPADSAERATVYRLLVVAKGLPPMPEIDEITDDSPWFRRYLHAIRIENDIEKTTEARERKRRQRERKAGSRDIA